MNQKSQTFDVKQTLEPEFLEDDFEVTVYHGFTKEYESHTPFDIDFDNACCHVIKANQSVALEHNKMLDFDMLESGDWFVMGKQDGQVKFSFKYKSAEAAMDIAKEKFNAVKFLSLPEFI